MEGRCIAMKERRKQERILERGREGGKVARKERSKQGKGRKEGKKKREGKKKEVGTQ